MSPRAHDGVRSALARLPRTLVGVGPRVAVERLLLIALGVGLEWASMPPGPLPWLAFAADAPFLWLLWHRGGERWKRWALLYGLARFVVGLRWLFEIGPLQGVGAPLILAPVQLLWGLSIRFAVKRRVPFLFVVPVTAVLEEWLRTAWMGGMPWPARSLALTAWPSLLAFASQFGAYGLSFLAALSSAWVSGLPAILRRDVHRRFRAEHLATRGALVGLTVAAAFVVGGQRVDEVDDRMASGAMAVTAPFVVIQGNIPQSLKHSGEDKDAHEIFRTHLRLTAEALVAKPAALAVLWPETMIPWPFVSPELAARFPDAWENEAHVMGHLRGTIPERSHPKFLVGANSYFVGRKGPQKTLYEHDTRDSLFYVDPLLAPEDPPAVDVSNSEWRPPWEIPPARHDKVVLVPGGEYTPLGDLFPALRRFKEDMSSIPELTPGAPDQEPFLLDIQVPDRQHGENRNREVKAGTVICFEIAFPARCRSWRDRGATVLLNPANYGWFGDTGMPAQIRAIARLRAAELAVTVVVAGNTGPTAIIDPAGRVTQQVHRGGRTQYVEGWCAGGLWSDSQATRYVLWGDIPWAVAGVLVLATALLRGRGARGSPAGVAPPSPDSGASGSGSRSATPSGARGGPSTATPCSAPS